MTSHARYAAARARAELRRLPAGEWVEEIRVGRVADRKTIAYGITTLVELGEVEEDRSYQRVRVRLTLDHHPDGRRSAAPVTQQMTLEG